MKCCNRCPYDTCNQACQHHVYEDMRLRRKLEKGQALSRSERKKIGAEAQAKLRAPKQPNYRARLIS